jgi:arylsulfatase A
MTTPRDIPARRASRGAHVLSFGLAAVALGATASGAATAPAPRFRPNIVVFYADDMGLGDTSAYQDLAGNPDEHQLHTPELERLASMGMRFTNAHAAAAVCTPSRISLLTGTYSFRSPLKQMVGYEGQDVIGTYFPADRRTIPWMLRRHGYGAYGYGKWHLGVQGDKDGTATMQEGPLEAGFDTYTGTPGNFGNGGAMIRDHTYYSFDQDWNLVPLNSPDARVWDPEDDPEFCKRIQQINVDTMLDDLSGHVLDRPDAPFFVYYASHGNHTPWFTDDTIAGVPLTTDVTVAGGPVHVNTRPDDDGDGIPEPDDPLYDPKEDTHWDPYYVPATRPNPDGTNGPTERAKMVRENDVIVGLLLDFLETTDDPRVPGAKLIDNTLFVFTSDNGADLQGLPNIGAVPQSSDGVITRFRGKKGTPWEGGTREPMIVAWPGRVPTGATSDALVSQVDLYATLAAVVAHDLDPREAVDSQSVLPALTQGATGVVRASDLVYKRKADLLLRRGELKLHTSDSDFADTGDRFGDNLDFDDLVADRFFDLAVDLGEQNDLIAEPGHAATIADMLATLHTFTTQGFSRAGGAPGSNAANFTGGDFHTATSWRSYTADIDQQVPGTQSDAAAFICVDGTAGQAISGTRVVQRAGVIDFVSEQSQNSAIADGSVWLLEGGTLLDANSAIRIDDGGRLVVDGGTLDLGTNFKFLRMTKGDGAVEIRWGEASAVVLAFGELSGATPGAKTLTFGPGDGSLRIISSTDPIRFGDDGDPENDWIDFRSGSAGRLITKLAHADYLALWDAGRLRVDGLAGATTGASFDACFSVTDNGDGTTTLALRGGACPADLTGDGVADFLDVAAFLNDLDAGDPRADVDGSATLTPLDVELFLTLIDTGCDE